MTTHDLQDQTFIDFPKVPRLSRRVVITEKIDGSNGVIQVSSNKYDVRAGSRTRWITPSDDNFGFAQWVENNKDDLRNLGPGHHYGEWWGKGINRGYGLEERRFSLFNQTRWADNWLVETLTARPDCCHVTPVLYIGDFDTTSVDKVIEDLKVNGSLAVRGFMNPEGIVLYHSAANTMFKKTIEKDDEPKTNGGRRV